MPKFQAVIFDCDGVILDSQKLWDIAVITPWQETFPTAGIVDGSRFRGRSEHDAWIDISNTFIPIRSQIDHGKHMETAIHELYTRAEPVNGVTQLIRTIQQQQKPVSLRHQSAHGSNLP